MAIDLSRYLGGKTGTWSPFGITLPDYGKTEKYAKQSVQPTAFYNPAAAGTGQIGAPVYTQTPVYGPKYTPNQVTSKVTGGSANSGTQINTIANNSNAGVNDVVDQYSELLNQDYNNTINELSAQERNIRSQADIAQSQVGNEFASTQTQLGNEQATNLQGVQGQLDTAEKESTSAMRSARDMFRQTQQANIAQLSGLGISSSSVAEALAERLGVETMRRIGDVSQSLSDVRINAQKEIGRINNYFQEKKTQLEQTKALELSKIQQSLIAGIDTINAARDRAALDKARSRADLLNNAKSAVDAINNQVAKFQDSLTAWAKSRSQALQGLAQNPEWITSFMSAGQKLSEGFNPTQFSLTPTINQDERGNYSGKWTVSPKKNEQVPGEVDYSDPRNWQ